MWKEQGSRRTRTATANTLGIAALLVFPIGCTRSIVQTTSHGGPVRDHVSFIDHLRATGFGVAILGEAMQPFLRADEGTRLGISGGKLEQPVEVQSYQYRDAKVAEADAQGITPAGNPRTMQIDWVGPPHFYRRERVIVLYVGTDAAALELLSGVLGPQFAGR